jgi:hypothetical protein
MIPRLNRFRISVVTLALALAVLAGLAAAAYGLVVITAPSSRHTPAPATAHAPGATARLALRVIVSHHSVTLGGTVTYRVQIVRSCHPVRLCGRLTRYHAARVWLRLVKLVPTGLTARFTRPVTRAHTTALVLGATTTARPGRYRLRLQARTPMQPGRGDTASTVVTLTVNARPGLGVGIAGSPAGVLVPGSVAGIELALTNRHRTWIVVRSVSVSVKQIRAPRADAAHPCTPADFAVSQLSGSYRLALAPSSTRTLQQFGIDPARWPTVSMLDRPLNQDGCEGASVLLAYAGTATG